MPNNELILVPFHGDLIEAIRGEDGKPYVVPKRICENLGIAWTSQRTKLESAHWSGMTIIITPDERGRPQEHAVIPLDSVPMWLVTIHESRVDESIRPKLREYQNEAKDVLARHFTPQAVAASQKPSYDEAVIHSLAAIANLIQGQSLQFTALFQGQQAQLEQLRVEMDRRGELDKHPIGSQANPYRVVPPGYETHERFVRTHNLMIDARERKRERPMLCKLPGVTPIYYRQTDAGVLYRLFPMTALIEWFKSYMQRHPEASNGYLPGVISYPQPMPTRN